MTFNQLGKQFAAIAVGALTLLALSACIPNELQFGSRTLSFGQPSPNSGQLTPVGGQPLQSGPGAMPNYPTPSPGAVESFGRGPVQVAMLLPLSGDPNLSGIGRSFANAAKLAMAFIEANPNITENITITLRDTGSSANGAAAAASAAISSGARLIVGPIRTDAVMAAGAVARSSGVPLIGFANNPQAAGQGVYLLNLLPEMEMKRSLAYVKAQGRRGIAGAFPATEFGQAQETAFRQQAVAAGFAPHSVYTFTSASEAVQIVAQALPHIQSSMIDTLFIPDRASAPAFAAALAQAGLDSEAVQLVGSADWEGDPAIMGTSQLAGAIYPALDQAGIGAIRNDYQQKFGAQPHPLATIAYTATILANVNTLSRANPPYAAPLLTAPSGFNGRDGAFRFLPDGRSEYALAIKQVGNGGAQQIEGAQL